LVSKSLILGERTKPLQSLRELLDGDQVISGFNCISYEYEYQKEKKQKEKREGNEYIPRISFKALTSS